MLKRDVEIDIPTSFFQQKIQYAIVNKYILTYKKIIHQ